MQSRKQSWGFALISYPLPKYSKNCLVLNPFPDPSLSRYLLAFVNGGQRGHLTVLVGAKDLAERASGHLTAQAVDVDLLILVLLTHEMLLSLGVQRPEDQEQGSSDCQGARL